MPGTARDPLLQVSVARTRAGVVVRLDGELDLATAGSVAAALRPLTREVPPPVRVYIDAEQLMFLDAAGLTPLVDAHRRLPPGTLRVRNARPPVVRVLRLLGLANAFGIDA